MFTMPPKVYVSKKKQVGKENQEQFVLIRDETSNLLMLNTSNKVVPAKKDEPLGLGNVVSWQDNNRQRWRGPVLAIG